MQSAIHSFTYFFFFFVVVSNRINTKQKKRKIQINYTMKKNRTLSMPSSGKEHHRLAYYRVRLIGKG
jgi:hypothetical protein